MLDAAREAVAHTSGKTRADLGADRLLQLALTRLRQRFTSIPWPLVIGIRNRLVHGYDTVDLDIVWRTVKDSLPPFILALEKALETE